MYPYWCVEKGYARFVGQRDGSAAWTARARGWIRVMHLDIVVLARHLHDGDGGVLPARRRRAEPHGPRAGRARHDHRALEHLHADARRAGRSGSSTSARSSRSTERSSPRRPRTRACSPTRCASRAGTRETTRASRLRWRKRFVVVLSVVPVTFYWFLRSPVQMVVAGGVAQALMLPLIGGAVIYLRHTQLPDEIRPALGHDRHALDFERRDAGIRGVLRVVAGLTQLPASSFQLRFQLPASGFQPGSSRAQPAD